MHTSKACVERPFIQAPFVLMMQQCLLPSKLPCSNHSSTSPKMVLAPTKPQSISLGSGSHWSVLTTHFITLLTFLPNDERPFFCFLPHSLPVSRRWITSGEYIQMSGRAGRRGKDDRGIVIQMLDEKMDPQVAKGALPHVHTSDLLCR